MAVVATEQNGSAMAVSTNIRGIPDDLYEAIKVLAEKDMRSVNAEIIVLLQEAVARRQLERVKESSGQ